MPHHVTCFTTDRSVVPVSESRFESPLGYSRLNRSGTTARARFGAVLAGGQAWEGAVRNWVRPSVFRSQSPNIRWFSNMMARDSPAHQDQTDGTSSRGKHNSHPLAVVDETVNEPRDMKAVAFVEAHGTVVAG